MDEHQNDKFPKVIWIGRQPIGKSSRRLFRLVYRGPARENRPDDVPFAVELRIGCNMMKRMNWSNPIQGDGGQEAIWALSHVLGLALMARPESLVAGHPIHCELNMAILEGRVTKGCDCNGPADPMEMPVPGKRARR